MGSFPQTTPPGAGSASAGPLANGKTQRARELGLFAVPAEPPQYRVMLAVDIQAFNDPKRGDDAQSFLRCAMYAVLKGAFDRSGLDVDAFHWEDRGDGALVVAGPGAPATALIDPLADHLRAGVRAHNRFHNDLAKIGLRVSVHAGHVYFDGKGYFGQAVTQLFRMLDAGQFKRALAGSGSDFALVTSETLYEDVICHAPGLIDPQMYAPVDLTCKETATRGWVYLPPVPNPFLISANGRTSTTRRGQGASDAPTGPATTAPARAGSLRILFPQRPPSVQEMAGEKDRPPRDWRVREGIAARARVIAAATATMRERLAGAPAAAAVHTRLRERFAQGPGVQGLRRCHG